MWTSSKMIKILENNFCTIQKTYLPMESLSSGKKLAECRKLGFNENSFKYNTQWTGRHSALV